MKKTIFIFIFGVLPGVALASGGHGGGYSVSSRPVMKPMDHRSHNMSQTDSGADAGRPGDPVKVSRTIEVVMDDSMRFTPNNLRFMAGETVRFAVRNDGKIRHEMVIGSVAELKEHADMMRGNPAMQHTESNMVSVAPGEYRDLIWQFDKSGSFDFACLVAGHLEAGMTGKIKVR